MDIDLITNEVFNRLMEKVKPHQVKCDEITSKKFLQCDGDAVIISGYETVFLDDVKDKKEFSGYEFLVVCKLTIDEIASSVNGIAINDKTRALRQFLLNGKHVYIIEEGIEHRQYKAISNPLYYTIFREYEKQLIRCGVRIMSYVALESVLSSEEKLTTSGIVKKEKIEESKNKVSSSNLEYSTKKKLITYELAKQLVVEPEIILHPGTMITPYAKDVFKESNSTITFI
ncbi:hypothetical protein [Acetobacterium sp.]|uniref:hypothetical protein n=1 Tax=Acetobacterium sp. TaxID=1872094 RepID=UPI002F3E63E4